MVAPCSASSANSHQGTFSRVQNANGIAEMAAVILPLRRYMSGDNAKGELFLQLIFSFHYFSFPPLGGALLPV